MHSLHKIYILVHCVFTCHCVCVCVCVFVCMHMCACVHVYMHAGFHHVEHLIIECMINMAKTTNQKCVC